MRVIKHNRRIVVSIQNPNGTIGTETVAVMNHKTDAQVQDLLVASVELSKSMYAGKISASVETGDFELLVQE